MTDFPLNVKDVIAQDDEFWQVTTAHSLEVTGDYTIINLSYVRPIDYETAADLHDEGQKVLDLDSPTPDFWETV